MFQTITIPLRPTESLTGVPVLTDEYLGRRVLVQWYGSRVYLGTFDKMSSSGQYHITYDDGDERNYTLQRSVHGDLFALNRERTDDIHRFIIQDTKHNTESNPQPQQPQQQQQQQQRRRHNKYETTELKWIYFGQWICSKCTLINEAIHPLHCSACNSKRPPPKCVACEDDIATVHLTCHGSVREELCLQCFNSYLKYNVDAGQIKIRCPFHAEKQCNFIYTVPILRNLCQTYTQLDQTLPGKMANTLKLVQQQVTQNEMEQHEDFSKWLSKQKGNIRLCPACFVRIEKNKGCNHMHCYRCGHDFNWNEGGVRLPKSEEEKKQEAIFIVSCQEKKIATGKKVCLYWPSFKKNMNGKIDKLEDQLIHVRFKNGDNNVRRYTLNEFLQRRAHAERQDVKKTIPIMSNDEFRKSLNEGARRTRMLPRSELGAVSSTSERTRVRLLPRSGLGVGSSLRLLRRRTRNTRTSRDGNFSLSSSSSSSSSAFPSSFSSPSLLSSPSSSSSSSSLLNNVDNVAHRYSGRKRQHHHVAEAAAAATTSTESEPPSKKPKK